MSSTAHVGSLAELRTWPVKKAFECVLLRLKDGTLSCADTVATLCRDRGAELKALPVASAVELLKFSVATVACGVGACSDPADPLATLRHMFTCPALRKLAMKASRLQSWATAAIEGAKLYTKHADANATAILAVLQDVGLGITASGALELRTTPLIEALRYPMFGAAQALLDAGADVNGRCRDGGDWPLTSVARGLSDDGMAWLLERGASLALANTHGRTIVHLLASLRSSATTARDRPTTASTAEFCCRWLRRVVAAQPSLLDKRDPHGITPLLLAVAMGAEEQCATLLALGADVRLVGPSLDTSLSLACGRVSVPIVRQLLAAGAASEAALPPGSPQARKLQFAAIKAALGSEAGCDGCDGTCKSGNAGNFADGLAILQAVLAAGVRESVDDDGRSLAVFAVSCLYSSDPAKRVSAAHVLAVLQALHSSGVDVVSAGPADKQSALHAAAIAGASALVRWLATAAGAPLEERDREHACTPLLLACSSEGWAAAHALLDCGARVDVQSGNESRAWPVILLAQKASCDLSLLRRMLAADRDSLLREAVGGFTAMHLAASFNTEALKLLLGSGSPHVPGAVNKFTLQGRARDGTLVGVTPLIHACLRGANWESCLALLTAGARVDIATADGWRHFTAAEWARSSPECTHRGVKNAIAARAREHALEAGKAARGSSEARPLAAPAAPPAVRAAAPGPCVACGAGSHTGPCVASVVAGGGSAAGAAAGRSAGAKKRRAKGRTGRPGASRNRAEDSAECSAPGAPDAVDLSGLNAEEGSPPAAAVSAGCSVPEVPPSVLSAVATLNLCEDPSTGCAPELSALNLCEDPSAAAAAVGAGAHVAVSEPCAPSTSLPVSGEASRDRLAPAPGDAAGGAADGSGMNTCEPGEGSGAGVNTCEPGEAASSADA